ncbi:MAG: glycerol-3-phosphate 1-O-acyltransferase PlsY [Clostridia bacterium]|nr:glycerol-3-phosphate 1-O-acyltransferase PlsY [Clostridia bacterium]
MWWDSVLVFLQNAWLPTLIAVLAAYVIGSLDFAIILSKGVGKSDVREKGSGNAGATNVLREHGVKMALATTVGDVGKAAIAVALAQYVIFPLCGAPAYALHGAYAAAVFAVTGHLFPVFFGFRGGKGVTTMFGAFVVIQPIIALSCFAAFVTIIAISKMVSVGAISAATLISVVMFIAHKYWANPPLSDFQIVAFTTAVVIVSTLVIVKHKSNIKRILKGEERRISFKKKEGK